MGYVIAAIVVVLAVAGLIALLVRSAARRSNVSEAGALNDAPAHDDRPDVARPVVGGEGEARRSI
jgi:hypothetical protein